MIFLTGATGFLGSYILLELLEKGHTVTALKRSDSKMDQFERVFRSFSTQPAVLLKRIQWVEGDILDVTTLQEAMQDADTVIHSAGLVSFHPKHKKQLITINVEGTANVVNVALDKGIRKLLYISSIAALGRGSDDEIITEKTVWKNSSLNSRYAVSKYNGEKEVWRGQEEGLAVVVVNPAIILGYGDPGRGSSMMFETVKKGLPVYPDGMNGFVDVRDVAKACVLLAEKDIHGEKFILSAQNLSYLALFTLISNELGKKPPAIRVGKTVAALVWRWQALKSGILGKQPLLTRETAMTSVQQNRYDGTKITSTLGFNYTPPEESIRNIAAFLKKDFHWQ